MIFMIMQKSALLMTEWQTDKYFGKLFILNLIVLGMLSVERARKILSEEAQNMSDNQVQDFLDLLYSSCNVVWNKNSWNDT